MSHSEHHKGVITYTDYSLPLREVEAGTWHSSVCWIALQAGYSPWFLYNLDHLPRSGTVHSQLDPPHQPLTKKMPHRLATVQFERHFLSWGSSFLDDFSLCQVDKNLTSTVFTPTCLLWMMYFSPGVVPCLSLISQQIILWTVSFRHSFL